MSQANQITKQCSGKWDRKVCYCYFYYYFKRKQKNIVRTRKKNESDRSTSSTLEARGWESCCWTLGCKRMLLNKDDNFLSSEMLPVIPGFESVSSNCSWSPSAGGLLGGRFRIFAITTSASKSADMLEIRISNTAFSPWATNAPNIPTSCRTGPLSPPAVEVSDSLEVPVCSLFNSSIDPSAASVDLTRFADRFSSSGCSVLTGSTDLFLLALSWIESSVFFEGLSSYKKLEFISEIFQEREKTLPPRTVIPRVLVWDW